MKLSIVIPVYNGEKFLKECLDSVVAQTFKDYECIVINDGSSDASVNIINEYVERYPNFTLISQKNAGVSVARNKGIELAKGEYVTFVDCDDYIEECAYEQIFNRINNSKLEVVCFGVNQITSYGEFVTKVPFIHTDIVNDYIDYSLYMHSPFNKIFLKSHLKKYNILFNKQLSVLEDMEFSFRAICLAKEVFFVEDAYYYYRSNPNSVVGRGVKEKHIHDYKLAAELIETFCITNGIASDFVDYIEYRKMYYYMSFLSNVEFFSPQKYSGENQEKLIWKYGNNYVYKIISGCANVGIYIPAYVFYYLKKLLR